VDVDEARRPHCPPQRLNAASTSVIGAAQRELGLFFPSIGL
jgi:hypothetical protein